MSIDRGIDKEKVAHTHTYTHTHTRILLSHKKTEIKPFRATWIDLEIIILSEMSQRKTNTMMIPLIYGI